MKRFIIFIIDNDCFIVLSVINATLLIVFIQKRMSYNTVCFTIRQNEFNVGELCKVQLQLRAVDAF